MVSRELLQCRLSGEMHLELNILNLFSAITSIVLHLFLKFCTEHISDTAVLCANFPKWLGDREICYGQMRFHNIWVKTSSSQIPVLRMQQLPAPRDCFHNGTVKFSTQTSNMGLWWIWSDQRKQYKSKLQPSGTNFQKFQYFVLSFRNTNMIQRIILKRIFACSPGNRHHIFCSWNLWKVWGPEKLLRWKITWHNHDLKKNRTLTSHGFLWVITTLT